MNRSELKTRIATIEESYEFFLAYAAQGISDDTTSSHSGDLRGFLDQIDSALEGLADGVSAVFELEGLEPAQAYRNLTYAIRVDSATAQAAIRAVRSRSAISSQLIDNLNALVHLRALLTDLFFIDELLT